MMEKYGIEKVDPSVFIDEEINLTNDEVKTAEAVANTTITSHTPNTGNKHVCEHPMEAMLSSGTTKFCQKCGKYLNT